jgi:transglutaminase-like putative cysteine protease
VKQPLALPTLYRLLGCMALVLLPHFPRLPVWESLFVSCVLLWCGLGAYRHWPLPPAWLRAVLGLVVFGGVFASYGRINGQQAGVALLVAMTALKLTEMQTHRDRIIVIFVCYFQLITHFLFSQELVMVPFLLLGALMITAMLVELSHPQGPLPPRVILRGGGTLVLHSLPLMLVLFVLFPRIPGPLWGLPSDAGAGRTGLSDKMEPGSISALSLSDDVAFRVRFLDPAPARKQMYWRGPSFWVFDGRSWSPGIEPDAFPPPAPEVTGPATRYEITLEPHGQRWLLALDMPIDGGPAGSLRSIDYELLAPKPVNDRLLYQATSHLEYRIQPSLWPRLRERALQLPYKRNPRTRELVERWRSEGTDDTGIINNALRMFHDQEFIYTHQPPLLGRDSIDEFLFGTRSGFCEHYASAFVFMMRVAGIPARVVTGYLGGERNPAGDYYIVRQSDAHAWAEVWLQDRGWVRIDPTGAIAPQRIQKDAATALSLAEQAALPFAARNARDWLHVARLRWDWVNAGWNRWVLAYGPELQASFLSHLGMPDWQAMILALTALMTAFLMGLGALLLWQARPAVVADPALREWQRFCSRLAGRELPRLPHEGPRDYVARVLGKRPDLREQAMRICGLYIRLRYDAVSDSALEKELAQSVRRFRP